MDPGVGTARLCLGIVQVIWPDFPDGVFFVALGSIRDPALVTTAITQVLSVEEAGDRSLTDLLKSYIRDKSLLLVLANFAHVLPVAILVAELLPTCPRLTVLATSRVPLHIRAERQFLVAPLALPDLTDSCDVRTTPGRPVTFRRYLAAAAVCRPLRSFLKSLPTPSVRDTLLGYGISIISFRLERYRVGDRSAPRT